MGPPPAATRDPRVRCDIGHSESDPTQRRDAGGRLLGGSHRASLGWIFERGLTRRDMLGAAAAAGMGCVLARAGQAEATLWSSSARVELTPPRRRTYEALVAAVIAAPPLRLDPACAGSAAAHFERVYSTWSADARQRADGVLEALGREPDGPPFCAQPRSARATLLRACARVTSDAPSGAERGRLALLEGALELVAVAVGPGEDAGGGLVSV
jgi:hypothetical protein